MAVAVELPAGAEPDEAPEPWRLAIVESSHFQGVLHCSAFAVETVWIVKRHLQAHVGGYRRRPRASSIHYAIDFLASYATAHVERPLTLATAFVRQGLLEIGSRRELRHVYAKWAVLTGESAGARS